MFRPIINPVDSNNTHKLTVPTNSTLYYGLSVAAVVAPACKRHSKHKVNIPHKRVWVGYND